MSADFKGVASRAAAACDTLLIHYEARVLALGGIDMPNEEESKRAREVAKYFEGGLKPAFMAANQSLKPTAPASGGHGGLA